MNIDDPKYWEALSDEEVVAQMQSGQANSLIWNRAEGELKIRQFKRSMQNKSVASSAPPPADFSCVTSTKLRAIAERDWKECWAALNAGCWKSVIVLTGGILETVILSMLTRRKTKALKAGSARGFRSDIQRWTLGQMIAAAEGLKLFGPEIKMLPHPVKEYRNLAHPGDEIREGLNVSEASATASLHTLRLILDELSKAKGRGSKDIEFTFV